MSIESCLGRIGRHEDTATEVDGREAEETHREVDREAGRNRQSRPEKACAKANTLQTCMHSNWNMPHANAKEKNRA